MMSARLLVTLLLFPALVAGSPADALAADDECQASDVRGECALNALQLRAHKAGEGGTVSVRLRPEEPDEAEAEGSADEQVEEATSTAAPATVAPTTAAPTCIAQYQQCGGVQYEGLTECCGSLVCYGKNQYYSQCVDRKDVPVVFERTRDMVEESSAPLYTFYVYRVMSNETYAPQNVNVANLPGVMWYLHNEVVITSPRKFNIQRILRFKMQAKAPKPLYDAGMNFGVRYAFDKGMCTGPWECDKYFQEYGYFVGCNNLGDFPFPTYSVAYEGGIWYSLPGACSSKEHNNQDNYCKEGQPGGSCAVTPNGNGTCTYRVEMAGEINIDELEGIGDYEGFVAANNTEYNETTDRGDGLDFWNDKNSTAACGGRVRKADALFKKKYPDMPSDADMPSPKCDFDFMAFYGVTLEAMNSAKGT